MLFRGIAVARATFIISKFILAPRGHGSKNFDVVFDYFLPRGELLSLAIDTAMGREGFSYTRDAVEVTEQQAFNIKALWKMFTAHDCKYEFVDEALRQMYSYSFIGNVTARPGQKVQSALSDHFNYQAPTPLLRLRRDPDTIYENVHTALRKVCDSKVSSATWNAMQIITRPTRLWLIDAIEKPLVESTHETVESFVEAIKGAILDAPFAQNYEKAMMHSLFEQFDTRDWEGFCGFLIVHQYEIDAENRQKEIENGNGN